MPGHNSHHIIGFYGKVLSASASSQRYGMDRSTPYRKQFQMQEGSPLVFTDFRDPDIADGSIAYHPVFGDVRYKSSWRFSTERFISDLKAADANPAINAHLIHVDSCGGEAFGCHEAFMTVRSLSKTCYGLIDSVAASAGYYLVAGAKMVYASSMFSEIGCIGIMSVMVDDAEMLKKWGLEEHEYYSNYSPLKNKVFNDARHGNGEEFVKRFLDPYAFQFIDDIRSARKKISEEALQGETYYAADAMPAGLIDGEASLEEVVGMISEAAKPKQSTAPAIDINKFNF